MPPDLITLNEAALKVKKSVQTLRRLIKKGELHVQRIRTPQGFNYMVSTDQLSQLFSNSPIQNGPPAQPIEQKPSAPIQEKILISRTAQHAQPQNDYYVLDIQKEKNDVKQQNEIADLKKELARAHVEKMKLMEILGRLQEQWWKNRL
ncbi:MAG: hypothetical protein AAB448_03260 [Patescibacteria group bacterium]